MTHKTSNEIRIKGIKALSKELNPEEMIQFFQFYENGTGNYTNERRKIFKNSNINDLEKMITRTRNSKNKK